LFASCFGPGGGGFARERSAGEWIAEALRSGIRAVLPGRVRRRDGRRHQAAAAGLVAASRLSALLFRRADRAVSTGDGEALTPRELQHSPCPTAPATKRIA
jgi:hypothetical protein